MALIWTESAQRIRTSANYARAYAFVGLPTWNATGGRNNGPNLTGGYVAFPADPPPSGNVFVAGLRLAPAVSAGNRPALIAGYNKSGVTTSIGQAGDQLALWENTSRGFDLRRGNIVIASSTSGGLITSGSLYYIAVKFVIDGSVGSAIVYLDGAEVDGLTLTNTNTDNQSTGTWNCVQFNTQSAGQFHDGYALDGTQPHGDDPNDLILDARVDYVGPDGNGYISQFTGSDADSVDNYLHVDENNPDDDTSYVQRTASGKDAYTVGASPLAGATLIGVTSFGHGRKSDAGVAVARTGFRVGGVDYMQPNNKALPITYREFRHHWGHDPSNGAWSEAVFNGAELVLEKV